jgi:lysophospholipase L1-like esterase
MRRGPVGPLVFLGWAVLLPACGGNGLDGPSPLPTPVPTPTAPTHSVTFTAFLDENENRSFESNEGTRIPGVEIVVGSMKGASAVLTGAVTLQVPEGTRTLEVTPSSLPPFYRPPTSITFNVPANGPVMVPITLPRGSNRANVYMAFGDSITNGEPDVGDGNGYRRLLQDKLRAHFGSGEVANEGRDATDSDFGAEIIGTRLAAVQPSFVLVHYGTNDWNRCKQVPCFTTPSLRFIVQQVNRQRGHAFLASIIPANIGYDARVPPSRQDWISENNVLIKQIADEEGAVYVDLNSAFLRSGRPLPTLFVDHLHPTAFGYELMAQTWFDAITKAYSKILASS